MSYSIAILTNVYNVEETPTFYRADDRQGGDPEYYDTISEAQGAVDEMLDQPYMTRNNEAGRPCYYIVSDIVADYMESGRNGDMGNYDWDTCDCPDECCGECTVCHEYMVEQDRSYIINNVIDPTYPTEQAYWCGTPDASSLCGRCPMEDACTSKRANW